MSCAHWRRLVALYVGDDLDRSRTEKVESHLAACAECRHLEEELRNEIRSLSELSAAAMAGTELGSVRGVVMARVESQRKRSLVFSPPRLMTAVAAAVIVIALALLFRQVQGPDVPRTVSREIPSPAPGLVAVPEPRETSLPQPTPPVVQPVPNNDDTRLARVEARQPGLSTSSPPSVPAEPMTIKILTDDPAVVIYWIVDPKGDEKHV